MRKNCLVKISGDMLQFPALPSLIGRLRKQYFVVVCVGGGTEITRELEKKGFVPGEFGPLGRQLASFEARQAARDVLERHQAAFQDVLARQSIHVSVVIPVIDVASVLCHVNGDQYVLAAYHGFDTIQVLTTKDRLEEKERFFASYPKVRVLAFDVGQAHPWQEGGRGTEGQVRWRERGGSWLGEED